MSTADHPESDGQIERVNKILEDMLCSYVSNKQSNWEDYLPILELAYNSSKHLAIRFTPFILMYGFQPRSHMAIGLEKEKIQYVKDFLEDMNNMLKASRESIRSAQDRAKTYANKVRIKVTFEKGDFVFLKVPAKLETMKMGKCDKLSPRYCGPFKVFKKIEDVAYKLELQESSQVHPVFHANKLKKSVHGLENIVSTDILEDLIEPPKIPHEPKRILGVPQQKIARQWDKAPYEVDELSTNEKSHITEEVLAQIPAHIFIAKFRDAKGDSIKTTTIMPKEIWTLHRRPEVANAIEAVHLK
ncbi:hypothetical protein L7F22_043052 [Adiantum nelumboides]|nr:hypothetical protein [Adiantum nelumboides]